MDKLLKFFLEMQQSCFCRKYIEGKKVDVKSKIESLDYYWAAKLSGEAIRKYIKEKLNADLTEYINNYMACEFKNIVSNLFVQKIIDQKKIILEKIAAVFN